MILRRIALTMALLCAVAVTPAHAIDGFSFEIGTGEDADMARVGVQWDWKKRWFQTANWHLGGYWDVAFGYWHTGDAGKHGSLFDLGVTPVFRFQPNGLVGPYVEAAIGFHAISHTSIGGKRFSTAFQFGDHIGAGYRFGAKGSYDLGYRFQHLSNGSIKRPNQGINFHQIRLQYNF